MKTLLDLNNIHDNNEPIQLLSYGLHDYGATATGPHESNVLNNIMLLHVHSVKIQVKNERNHFLFPLHFCFSVFYFVQFFGKVLLAMSLSLVGDEEKCGSFENLCLK